MVAAGAKEPVDLEEEDDNEEEEEDDDDEDPSALLLASSPSPSPCPPDIPHPPFPPPAPPSPRSARRPSWTRTGDGARGVGVGSEPCGGAGPRPANLLVLLRRGGI